MGTGSFPGVKRPVSSVDLPTHLEPRLRKSLAIPLLSFWNFVAYFRVNFLFYYML